MWTTRKLQSDPIDEELRHHYEMLRQERLDEGDTPEEASRYARHRLGHAPAILEEVRQLSLRYQLESALRHTRFALRSFTRHGGAYLLATAILSIGIALSVALFSLVDAVLLAPLPFPHQERVHLLWKSDPNQPQLVGELAYPELADLQANIPEAEAVALFPAAPYGNGRTLQTATGEPVQIESCPSSPDFFKALGVQPVIGRGFTPADSAPGATPLVVLSDRVWRQHFSSQPDVVNQQVRLNGRAHTVIGVMPPAFDFPRGIGLWVNLPAATKRGTTWLQAVVRLRPGASRDALQAAAARAFQLQALTYPGQYSPTQRAAVTPIADFLTGSSRTQLLLSLAASVLLLFSAAVSAGNLFLSRALGRRQEVATRISLGATQRQLLAQFLTEALVAATLATVSGAALAVVIIRLLTQWAPADIPRIENAGLNLPALVLAALTAVIATVACALGPLLLLRRKSLEGLMRSGGSRMAGSRSGGRLQRTFVLLQAAFTVTILLAGVMLLTSYRALLRTGLGLENRDTLTVNLALRGPQITPDNYRQVYNAVLERLRANPNVTKAAGVLLRPLEGPIGWDAAYTYEFENSRVDPHRQLKANFEVITPGYFEAIGTPLLGGRDFDEHDAKETEKVLIISQSVAGRFRDVGLDPIGKRMGVFGELRKVVGIVADARFRGVRQPGHDVYVPSRQIDIPTNYLIVRGTIPMAELLDFVRRTVKELAPEQAIAGEATLGALIDRNTARDRFNVALLLLFAAGAVLLAAAGIHSVTRESVAVRAKEIAIRIALGADRNRVAVQCARAVLLSVAGGAVAGIAFSLLLAPAAQDVLYAVSPRDPVILAAVVSFVLFIAAISSFVPAWKAASRDPRGSLLSDS